MPSLVLRYSEAGNVDYVVNWETNCDDNPLRHNKEPDHSNLMWFTLCEAVLPRTALLLFKLIALDVVHKD